MTDLLAQSKLLLTVARSLELLLAETYASKDARTLDLTQAIVDFTHAKPKLDLRSFVTDEALDRFIDTLKKHRGGFNESLKAALLDFTSRMHDAATKPDLRSLITPEAILRFCEKLYSPGRNHEGWAGNVESALLDFVDRAEGPR